jgi:hypothetical protein
MKYTVLALTIAIVALTSVNFGQGLSVNNDEALSPSQVEARMRASAGIIDFAQAKSATDLDRAVQRNVSAMQRQRSERFGPGDRPTFLLNSNLEFAQTGETMNLSLSSMVTTNRKYTIGIQILKPGPDGDYDGTVPPTYASPLLAGGRIKSPELNESFPIYAKIFTDDDTIGRWRFNVLIWDENYQLVQQLWFDVHHVDSGPWEPWFIIKKIEPTSGGYVLTGNLPLNIPIYYRVGAGRYVATITGPDPQFAPRSDGHTVTLFCNAGFAHVVALDFTMWSPYTRQAIVKPKGYVQYPAQ